MSATENLAPDVREFLEGLDALIDGYERVRDLRPDLAPVERDLRRIRALVAGIDEP